MLHKPSDRRCVYEPEYRRVDAMKRGDIISVPIICVRCHKLGRYNP